MLETVLSLDTWITAAIGAVVSYLMSWLYRLVHRHFPAVLNTTWSSVRGWARAREKAHLQRIRAIRFDSMRINREIARSYAFLVLFLVGAMLYAVGLLLAPKPAAANHALLALWGFGFGIPMLSFELAWLLSSSRVDAILKSRAKITSRGRRLR
ncbi:hypothetical protein [Pseudomonas linyingensis]|uniref:hypothetical protein n=1 Tax=Pseudomonas linyingensis TaxID=915471 RepID=UPI000B7FF889|nr:hypothetical protein [Pseudomonas linyingensis]